MFVYQRANLTKIVSFHFFIDLLYTSTCSCLLSRKKLQFVIHQRRMYGDNVHHDTTVLVDFLCGNKEKLKKTTNKPIFHGLSFTH